MTREDIRSVVLDTLAAIAPEADPAALRPDVPIREQLDLDSMDALNFVIGLHETLGVEIPEADYAKLTTVDRCVAYLEARA
jgi:acyl carrier protein